MRRTPASSQTSGSPPPRDRPRVRHGSGVRGVVAGEPGKSAGRASTPATQIRPPLTMETRSPKMLAPPCPTRRRPDEAHRPPRRGRSPCRRPRSASGVATCRIVDRNTALTMSAAPARARNPPRSRGRENPNAAMARPHTTMATMTARPCRRTRCSRPEKTAPVRAPIAGAASSRPTDPAPPRRTSRPRRGTAPEACRRPSPRCRRGTTSAGCACAGTAAPRRRTPTRPSPRPDCANGGSGGSRGA